MVMKAIKLFLWLGLTLIGAGWPGLRAADAPIPAVETKESAERFAVETAKYEWTDATRERQVPVKIYYPKGAGPFPIIIFSHGLGGTSDGYAYLGQYWASNGYVSVHVQHVGSDDSVWRGYPAASRASAMNRAAQNITNALNRPVDVIFAIDEVLKMNRGDSPLKGKLDVEKIGVAGHSFGAFTALAVAGQVFVTPSDKELTLSDSRVKAAIPMSAPVPKSQDKYDRAFSEIKIPCFHMTGTKDDSPIGETSAAQRRIPFDHCNGSDQFLLTFEGGDHAVFSNQRRVAEREMDARFQPLICKSSTKFWDAYLKGDAKAKEWLTGNGFSGELGDAGKFEKKLAGATKKVKE